MPGGKFSSPIFTPYVLYGSVDYMYGWPAYNENNGFTGAQASLNAIETVGYIVYLWIVWKHGRADNRALFGGWGGLAVLVCTFWISCFLRHVAAQNTSLDQVKLTLKSPQVGFALSVMTLSKTVLYGKCTQVRYQLYSYY